MEPLPNPTAATLNNSGVNSSQQERGYPTTFLEESDRETEEEVISEFESTSDEFGSSCGEMENSLQMGHATFDRSFYGQSDFEKDGEITKASEQVTDSCEDSMELLQGDTGKQMGEGVNPNIESYCNLESRRGRQYQDRNVLGKPPEVTYGHQNLAGRAVPVEITAACKVFDEMSNAGNWVKLAERVENSNWVHVVQLQNVGKCSSRKVSISIDWVQTAIGGFGTNSNGSLESFSAQQLFEEITLRRLNFSNATTKEENMFMDGSNNIFDPGGSDSLNLVAFDNILGIGHSDLHCSEKYSRILSINNDEFVQIVDLKSGEIVKVFDPGKFFEMLAVLIKLHGEFDGSTFIFDPGIVFEETFKLIDRTGSFMIDPGGLCVCTNSVEDLCAASNSVEGYCCLLHQYSRGSSYNFLMLADVIYVSACFILYMAEDKILLSHLLNFSRVEMLASLLFADVASTSLLS